MHAPEWRCAGRGNAMIENVILLFVAALLLGYLVYALLKPEKF
jgi:K+-transporting ATPase KdpF subunit